MMDNKLPYQSDQPLIHFAVEWKWKDRDDPYRWWIYHPKDSTILAPICFEREIDAQIFIDTWINSNTADVRVVKVEYVRRERNYVQN